MNWLENNPVGVALAAVGGVLLMLMTLLAWAWSWPVSSGNERIEDADQAARAVPEMSNDLGPLSGYQVVNDRPVFNESRRPQVSMEGEEELAVVEPDGPAAAPEVKLTGVVITPDMRIVTLTPNKDGEPVIVREGAPLEGEYVGWSVSSVDARNVKLQSSAGETLDIELAVHDAMIAEPPKPKTKPEKQAPAQEDGAGEQLTRAEEIRQRIQERREQLRREAEQEEEQKEADKEAQRNSYQEAIRTMMNRNRNDDDDPEEDED